MRNRLPIQYVIEQGIYQVKLEIQVRAKARAVGQDPEAVVEKCRHLGETTLHSYTEYLNQYLHEGPLLEQ